MGTLECVFSVCLGVCTGVCVGGEGQPGAGPEKLYLRPTLPSLRPFDTSDCLTFGSETPWRGVWRVAVSGLRLLNAVVSLESSHRDASML